MPSKVHTIAIETTPMGFNIKYDTKKAWHISMPGMGIRVPLNEDKFSSEFVEALQNWDLHEENIEVLEKAIFGGLKGFHTFDPKTNLLTKP